MCMIMAAAATLSMHCFVLRLCSPAVLTCKLSVFSGLSRHKAQMGAVMLAHDVQAEEQMQRLRQLQVLPLACIALYGAIYTCLLSLHMHSVVMVQSSALCCPFKHVDHIGAVLRMCTKLTVYHTVYLMLKCSRCMHSVLSTTIATCPADCL